MYKRNKILFINTKYLIIDGMIDSYGKKLRHIQGKFFEQNIDLIYFSKMNPKFDKNSISILLQIEALFQKSLSDFYMIKRS